MLTGRCGHSTVVAGDLPRHGTPELPLGNKKEDSADVVSNGNPSVIFQELNESIVIIWYLIVIGLGKQDWSELEAWSETRAKWA